MYSQDKRRIEPMGDYIPFTKDELESINVSMVPSLHTEVKESNSIEFIIPIFTADQNMVDTTPLKWETYRQKKG